MSFDNTEPKNFHTDIVSDGWISRLPDWARPYALLMRLDRPIGTWLLLLPGWWAIAAASGGVFNMKAYDFYLLILFGLGAVIMRGAGCAVNDLSDRKIDASVERTKDRPLASGAVSVTQASLLVFILLWIGLIILVQLSPVAIFLGVVSVVMLTLYPLAKRITWYPQAALGLTFNMGALMGWASVTHGVEWPALFLYSGGILWTLGYDTIYAHQDKYDDALLGLKSTALKFGVDSRQWIARFYAGTAFFLLLCGILSEGGAFFYVFWACACFHLIWQIYKWDEDSAESCLKVFRSNRDFALLIFAAFLFGFWH